MTRQLIRFAAIAVAAQNPRHITSSERSLPLSMARCIQQRYCTAPNASSERLPG